MGDGNSMSTTKRGRCHVEPGWRRGLEINLVRYQRLDERSLLVFSSAPCARGWRMGWLTRRSCVREQGCRDILCWSALLSENQVSFQASKSRKQHVLPLHSTAARRTGDEAKSCSELSHTEFGRAGRWLDFHREERVWERGSRRTLKRASSRVENPLVAASCSQLQQSRRRLVQLVHISKGASTQDWSSALRSSRPFHYGSSSAGPGARQEWIAWTVGYQLPMS